MTRKHFEAVAAIIAKRENWEDRRDLASDFIDLFEKENPNFDAVRFIKACKCTAADRPQTEWETCANA